MRKTQFATGNFYHIFNRGVEKRNIFVDDNDRWRFLQGLFLFNDEDASVNLLWQVERNFGRATFKTIQQFLFESGKERKPLVKINADCLMHNHFHLLLEEIQNGGISKFMHKLGTGYTMFFNKKYNRAGSLFQGPFKSVMVDTQEYLERLLLYINVINPAQIVEPDVKVAGVKKLEEVMTFVNQYPWSTQQEYLGTRESVIVDKSLLGKIFDNPRKYQDFSVSILKEKRFKENLENNLFIE